MKWTPIILGVLAACAMWLLGAVAVAVHKAHTFSTYSTWNRFGMINESAVEEYNSNLSPEQRCDMLGQLEQAGNVRGRQYINCTTHLFDGEDESRSSIPREREAA